MPDKNFLSNMNSRQKLIAGVVVLVVIVLVWQLYSILGQGSGERTASKPAMAASPPPPQQAAQSQPAMIAQPAPAPKVPQQAELPKPTVESMSPLEVELMRLQQETQAKYLAALNQLQMLKIERDIAENNRAIMSARLSTVKDQKSIVDMLAPPQAVATSHSSYAQDLVGDINHSGKPSTTLSAAETMQRSTQQENSDVKYVVISVSQLQNRWSAVLGYQGNLYNISVGDVLPSDGSKVISISSSGVVLDKDGEKKKISLVPII